MVEVKQGLAELVIQGPGGQTVRHRFIEGQTVRLGRSPAVGLAVAWDRTISREHADLLWQSGRLSVTCLVAAMNPVKFRGEALRSVMVGRLELFEIGQSKFYVESSFATPANATSPTTPFARETMAGMALSTAEVEFQTCDEEHEEFLEEHSYPSTSPVDPEMSCGRFERTSICRSASPNDTFLSSMEGYECSSRNSSCSSSQV